MSRWEVAYDDVKKGTMARQARLRTKTVKIGTDLASHINF